MSLLERLNRDPEPWKPEPGDTVVGVVVAMTEREGGYGPYPLVSIETDDGREIDVHGYHAALRNELMELDVRVGDHLGIKFRGPVAKVDGSGNYNGYRVVHERAERLAGQQSTDGGARPHLPEDYDSAPVANATPDAEPVAVPLLPGEESF